MQKKGGVYMSDLSSTIFGKIIAGQLPAAKIYEDENFLVILDKFPSSLGHCLILPKTPARNIFDLDEGTAQALYPLAKRIANAVKTATNADGIHILQNNEAAAWQTVFYFHIHIIPRHENDGVQLGKSTAGISEEQSAKIAVAIRRELG